MNQIQIGIFIAEKRKEKNLTQEQLAERLGVSNKTVSKWECGRCMPDYSLIEKLCKELNISVGELISGHTLERQLEWENESVLQLFKEIHLIKLHNLIVYGALLILLSLIMLSSSFHSSWLVLTIISDVVSGVAMIGGVFAVIFGEIRIRKVKKSNK